MAIAWSRISSKVIATPLSAAEADRRRCGNGTRGSDVCIPHMVNKGKQEVLGVRDAAGMRFSHMRGGTGMDAGAYFNGTRPPWWKGVPHVSSPTMHTKTHQSQTPSLSHSAGAPHARPPPSTTRRHGPPA